MNPCQVVFLYVAGTMNSDKRAIDLLCLPYSLKKNMYLVVARSSLSALYMG